MEHRREFKAGRSLGICMAALGCAALLIGLASRGKTLARGVATGLERPSPSPEASHSEPESELRLADEGLARLVADAPSFSVERPSITPEQSTWNLRLNWDEGGGPVTAAPVGLERFEHGTWRATSTVKLTDHFGEVEFQGLDHGTWRAACELGAQIVRELSGERHHDEMVLERGPSLMVMVQDERGMPVSGAGIWILGSTRTLCGLPSGLSTPDGTFELVDVGRARFVAATAPGHAPSFATEILSVGSDGPVEVSLEVRRNGASLSGRVLDGSGVACASAAVELLTGATRAHRFEVGGIVPPIDRMLLYTDVEGRFECGSLPISEVPLTVRGPDGGSWRGSVRIEADRASELEIRLEAGIVVRGRVTDTGHRPVAGAEVSAALRGSSIEVRSSTDSDGSYELRDVPRGSLNLLARDTDGRTCRGEMHCGGSEACGWDAVLEEFRALHGRLLDEQHEPLVGWTLRVEKCAGEGAWVGWGFTEAEGAFEIPCPASAGDRFDVTTIVPGPSGAEGGRFPDLAPNVAPHVLIVTADHEPRAWIVGAVEGPTLRAGGSVQLKLMALGTGLFGGAVSETTTAKDGAFRLGPLSAGRYELWAHGVADPATRLGTCEVDGTSTQVDLGSLQLEGGGSLALDLFDGTGIDKGVVTLWIRMQDGTYVVNEQLEVGPDGRYRVERTLAPGAYTLQAALLDGYRLMARTPEVEFEVSSGQITPLTAKLRSEQT